MSGNTFGKLFTVTTFGESHGPAYGCIVDGCPPNMDLSVADIQHDLDRRKPGQSKFTSQRREEDKVEILSGVFEGKTTGTSIGLLVRNTDQRPRDYEAIKNQFRPGHADFTYQHKYGIRDYRGSGRASARDTVTWVAAGAIAKKYLREKGVHIQGYLSQIGSLILQKIDLTEVERNPFFSPDPSQNIHIENLIEELRRNGDSIGACVCVEASGVPIGLGEPTFDRLEGDIAKALMNIPAVKGVEIGEGFSVVTRRGTEHRDAIGTHGFLSNRTGGILGGISNGEPIVARIAFKPTSSITTPIDSIDIEGNPVTVVTKGRHDPCVALRAVPIAEAMLALVLMDHFLRFRGQCGTF